MNEFLKIVGAGLAELDFPAVILFLMLAALALVMEKAQRMEDFDWTEAFRDHDGHVSWIPVAMLVSLALSSWILIYAFMNGIRQTDNSDGIVKVLDMLFKYFLAYMAMWAMGPKFVEKVTDAVLSKWFPKPMEAPVPKADLTVTTTTAVSQENKP